MSLLTDTIKKEKANVAWPEAKRIRHAAKAKQLTKKLMADLVELEPKLAPNGDIHISDSNNFYCRILVDSSGYRIAHYEDTDASGASPTFLPNKKDKERLIHSIIIHLPQEMVQKLSMKAETKPLRQTIADLMHKGWGKLKQWQCATWTLFTHHC